PDVGDDARRRAGADLGQAVHLLQGRQQVVVVDRLVVVAGGDVLADDDRGDLVVLGGVVLVTEHDQQAVVGLRPGRVGGDVGLEPAVGGGDGAVVHVVVQVRDDERERRQARVVRGARERGERQRVRGRHVGEVDPRRVLAGVLAGGAGGRAGRGQALGVALEGVAGAGR